MKDMIFHPDTRQQLENFLERPSHALMLIGPAGSGKRTVAVMIATELLKVPKDFQDYAYARILTAENGKSIGIEAVRELEQFLSLKVPGKQRWDRVIIIQDAHLLTVEAQNALLKNLEEPPAGTIFILTITHRQAVLPTILSRAQTIAIKLPERQAVETYFKTKFTDSQAIAQAHAISGGLPGLMQAILENNDHPLLQATEKARFLLSQSTYERLLLVDEFTKQRELAIDVLFILQQMAHTSLQSAKGPAAAKWKKVLTASYTAAQALASSGQPKLVFSELMLSL